MDGSRQYIKEEKVIITRGVKLSRKQMLVTTYNHGQLPRVKSTILYKGDPPFDLLTNISKNISLQEFASF